MLSACGHPEEKLIPALIPDDEYVPGVDYWKASACGMCDAGCGIIVRTREHRANKIEGNPLHPVNRGALCARGQAGLQTLYNPDRIRGPLKRTGERGSGQFEEISWDEAIKTLVDKLRQIRADKQTYNVAFATKHSSGVTGLAAGIFESAFMPPNLRMHVVSEGLSGDSEPDIYGRFVTPIFDIANATYLISFGARFLETWHSPVRYSMAYGEFRNSKGKPRGRFVHVEPRMSMTAANADEWLPARTGAEGLLALALAQVIIREGLRKDAPAPDFLKDPLENYAPEKIAEEAGIPAERIIRIAREFASAERPLAIGSARSVANARAGMTAINYLNQLVGNAGKPGGVLMPAVDYFDPLEKLRAGFRFDAGQEHWLSIGGPGFGLSALLIHQSNPVYKVPRAADEIKKIPFIASFSSFMDETTALADLILPDHTSLESWDISATPVDAKRVAVTINRPVVKPEFNTRQTADVLIAVSRQIEEANFSFSFESAEEIVRKAVEQLPGAGDEADSIIEKGVWSGEVAGKAQERDSSSSQFSFSVRSSVDADYPLTLIAYEHAALGTGEQANLPLLQELPDAMTSVMWGSWVEINPQTAAELGIADGDLVAVSSPHGTLRAPAVLYPAIRPDTVAMPYGQGHTGYGRYAKNRGVNVIELNPYLNGFGNRADTIQVKVAKAASDAKLIRFGTMLPEHIEVKR